MSKLPVILGFQIREVIGGGGFSKVYRAIKEENGGAQVAAVKIVACKEPELRKLLREVRVHETLKHANILEMFGYQQGKKADSILLYIVLAYASSGDLFDKIAPNVGLDDQCAHLYFTQLINGLAYIHSNGICHRDIKPENLLIDGAGNLLISDFGLCSVFRYRGQERTLTDHCGSPPYAAPELAQPSSYRAEPVDIWSAGIVLFALLVGNTPWDEPTGRSAEFIEYSNGVIFSTDPWNRIPESPMSLLRCLLTIEPTARISLQAVLNHPWVKRDNAFLTSTGLCANPIRVAEILLEGLADAGDLDKPSEIYQEVVAMSQGYQGPSENNPSQKLMSSMGMNIQSTFTNMVSLRSQASNIAPSQRRNPNLTRFVSLQSVHNVAQAILQVLIDVGLPSSSRLSSDGHTTVIPLNFTDNRKLLATGEVRLAREGDVSSDTMAVDSTDSWGESPTPCTTVEFRKLQGDPMSWRTMFRKIVVELGSIVEAK
ncbi:kinase-like protein [Atractiella rhizophila]|nr:kinase-like protein [Atractiella rhizophila]